MTFERTRRYDDIIGKPHHVSRRHPQMPPYKRAAQFMPFAALVGYEEHLEWMRQSVESEYDAVAKGAESENIGASPPIGGHNGYDNVQQ